MAIFDMNNPVWRTINKLIDLIWINILTLVCALPVFTAGAAFTAMHYDLLRMADNDEGALTRGFFKAFRENFKKATIIWVPVMLIMAIYAYNMYLVRQGVLDGYGILKNISVAVIGIIAVAIIMVMNYVFALLARYDNDVKNTLKNAALLSFAFFPKSVCMVILLFFPVALMMLSDYFLFLWFLYGFAYPGYLIAMLMLSVFRKIQERDEK